MTELEKLELSQPLTDIYTDMEHDLMVEIARRLAISGEIIPSDKWRLQKLAEAGELNKEVVEIISGYTGKQSEQLTETITAAANTVLEELEPSFRELAKEGYISGTSVPVSKTEKQVVKTFRKQAETDLNLVNTVMRYKAKQAYVDLVNKSFDAVQKLPDASNRQEILNTLGKHTLSVATGAESSQAAVRKCIQEFNRKGIPAFVDAAGRNWSPEAYVSMDIRTTVSNTAHAAVDARCDAYGIDLIAIDSHTGARPKCALDQGKVYSRSNQSGVAHDGDGNEVPFYPLSSTSYGQPDGILGINCRHHKYPFIDGVNYQRYFPIDQEKNAARYKEIQEQRRLERRVRETRREIDMLTAAGDKEGAAEAKRLLTERNKEYREYCDKHKLKQQYNRTRIVKDSDMGVTAPKIVDNGNSGVDKAGETTAKMSIVSNSKKDTTDKNSAKVLDKMGKNDIIKKISDVTGIDKDNIKISNLPEKAQKSICGAIEKSFAKFPQLKQHTNYIGFSEKYDEKTPAASASCSGKLYAGKAFLDFDKLSKVYDYAVRLKEHPKGTTVDSIFTHEIGHQIDGLLTVNKIWGDDGFLGTRTSKRVQEEVLSRLGFNVKDIRKEYYNKGYRGKELYHAIDFEYREFITNHVSEYAATGGGSDSYKEFFAECYAEYMDSPEPREAARIFGEILEELMKKL